jgi:GNAT superfamily N-acetyltransferase
VTNITLEGFEREEQIQELQTAFRAQGINREEGYFTKCYEENQSGERITIIAYYDNKLAGCSHLIKKSGYHHFIENGIPEINDLNVFQEYQRKGIAGKIIDELERGIEGLYNSVGIGVGLFKDYGTAQRLYCKKGYIPDGNGIQYNYKEVQPGTHVFVDDDLNLYFIKNLK